MEAMPYTQSLLAKGLAIGYHAKATSPTVTMPRLKVTKAPNFVIILALTCDNTDDYKQAMVSGAIGGFLDVASNFNTQAFLDDNLIG